MMLESGASLVDNDIDIALDTFPMQLFNRQPDEMVSNAHSRDLLRKECCVNDDDRIACTPDEFERVQSSYWEHHRKNCHFLTVFLTVFTYALR